MNVAISNLVRQVSEDLRVEITSGCLKPAEIMSVVKKILPTVFK